MAALGSKFLQHSSIGTASVSSVLLAARDGTINIHDISQAALKQGTYPGIASDQRSPIKASA